MSVQLITLPIIAVSLFVIAVCHVLVITGIDFHNLDQFIRIVPQDTGRIADAIHGVSGDINGVTKSLDNIDIDIQNHAKEVREAIQEK